MKKFVLILNTDILLDAGLFAREYEKADSARRKKTDRFRFGKDKRLSLGADILLRKGLERLGVTEFTFGYGENGKPFLLGCKDVFFNISHSGVYAVCAFSDKPVGVDIEKKHDFEDELIRYVYLQSEIDHIMRSSSDKNAAFTDLWTIKESLMKYLGTGISLEPKSICVSLDESITAQAEGFDCISLRFTQFHAPAGYSLTVCSEYEEFAKSAETVCIE